MAAEGGKKSPVFTPESIKNLCFHCKKEGPTNVCAACGITRYCSRKCQLGARGGHNDNCTKVKNHRAKINRLEAQLRSDWARDDEDSGDWMGSFWLSIEARNFCRARQQLAIDLVKIAETTKNDYTCDPEGYSALLEAEIQYLELLRLTQCDNQGIRYIYPFVLLALDRVQDCYDCVHWWATADLGEDYECGTAPEDVQPGQWIYSRGQDIKGDLFADPRVGNPEHFGAYHLTALIFVKIHLIKQLENGVTNAEDDSDTAACLKQQEQLLLRYCELMQKRNKWVLEGLANPEPMLAPGLPCFYTHRSIEEAKLVVHSARIVSNKKFGAREKIQEILKNGI